MINIIVKTLSVDLVFELFLILLLMKMIILVVFVLKVYFPQVYNLNKLAVFEAKFYIYLHLLIETVLSIA